MNKKFWMVISMAVVAALTLGGIFTSPAAAQGENPGRSPNARRKAAQRLTVLGQVTVVNAADFTIRTRQGDERSFSISERTRYLDRDRQEVDASAFKMGAWVSVIAPQAGAGKTNRPALNWLRQLTQRGDKMPLARVIVILPDGFNPDEMSAVRGQVSAVSATGFTVKDKDEKLTQVLVNADTRFNGQVKGLSELKVGMAAVALVQPQTGGGLAAMNVTAGNRQERRMGEVTAVDASAGMLTLKTARDGESFTFKVDADTRFRSKDDAIKSLADVKVGMMAIILGRSENGILIANVVAAGAKGDLPRLNR